MGEKKIRVFSEIIPAKDTKIFDEFVCKIFVFCGRWKTEPKIQFNQSSAIIGTKMLTHHTAIVEYEQNGS